MIEAAKAALDKAGFIIENLRNRIKQLEAENAKLKEPKLCETCEREDSCNLLRILIDEYDFEKGIDSFGCIDHREAP